LKSRVAYFGQYPPRRVGLSLDAGRDVTAGPAIMLRPPSDMPASD
jgi:hypothetical protein